nr:RidA family protein [Variovorax boronicumulans]
MTLLTQTKKLALAAALFAAACGAAHAADEVIRHRIPNSTFPIAAAVEVPSSFTNVYLSGQVPPLQDAAAPKNSAAAYGGDTKGQTIGVLKAIEKSLTGLGLTMGDVVKMQVFLVGDPAKDNKMDFAGFMEGYTQFFGTTAQPRLPVRSTMQVAALVNPAYLVEIEVTAVRPAKSK